MNEIKILNDYREADFDKRLHMYLLYPKLRQEFLEIDQNEKPHNDSFTKKILKVSQSVCRV